MFEDDNITQIHVLFVPKNILLSMVWSVLAILEHEKPNKFGVKAFSIHELIQLRKKFLFMR